MNGNIRNLCICGELSSIDKDMFGALVRLTSCACRPISLKLRTSLLTQNLVLVEQVLY